MVKRLIKKYTKRKFTNREITPEEIFVDSENLPLFNQHQFEGRIEFPISKGSVIGVVVVFCLFGLAYLGQIWKLQVANGDSYATASENNRLQHSPVFANRGLIYDRNDVVLAWNIPKPELDFSEREYISKPGFGNLLGYVKYPKKDKAGFYYDNSFHAFGGIESVYNEQLTGSNGLKIIETNALQEVIGDNTIEQPESGEDMRLTVDAGLQEKLYLAIADVSERAGYLGGAGVIMHIETGEILAVASYPEFDSNVLTNGSDQALITEWLQDPVNRFLNRATKGLYTPGSIMKPFVALGGLTEGVVTPNTIILSVKNMEVPNPYDPENPSFFSDWKARGPVDVRKALALSSNVYFYQVGGGYTPTGQQGLGITKLAEYYKLFGFGDMVNDPFLGGPSGVIPDPAWKEKQFNGEPWRLGDTYFTSIGQYGVQVTPMQVVRAVAAIANGGKLLGPKIRTNDATYVTKTINSIPENYYKVVWEGMRQAVLDGTAKSLDMPQVAIAAKTGSAELGVTKARVNSWVTGFFPYENPKYAFVLVMEQGDRDSTLGAGGAMRQVFEWMSIYAPEYLK
jgi:penicillin-binding protein 2